MHSHCYGKIILGAYRALGQLEVRAATEVRLQRQILQHCDILVESRITETMAEAPQRDGGIQNVLHGEVSQISCAILGELA